MIRKFITIIIPLLLPFILYFLYVIISQKPKKNGKGTVNFIKEHHHFPLLLMLGVILMIISLVFFGLSTGSDPQSQYTPPYYEDGKIIEGRFD